VKVAPLSLDMALSCVSRPHGLALAVDRDEVLFALYRTTHPGLPVLLKYNPLKWPPSAFAHNLDVAHLGFEY
jgi:hypothetical protein